MNKPIRRAGDCTVPGRATTAVRFGAVVGTFLGAVMLASVSGAATIAERYQVSDDLGGFIVQRAALPAEGSYFYAYLARRECRIGVAVARLLTDAFHQRVPSEIEADMARQRKRCANIPLPNNASAIDALENADRQTGAASGDKYFSGLAWTPAGSMRLADDEDVRRALRFFATTDDRNMRALELHDFRFVDIAVNGRRLDPAQVRAFELAMQLTGCALGVEDGGKRRLMGGIHTLFGLCDDPDTTAVRKRLSSPGNPFPPDWALIDAYQAQFLAAVRSGDWSAFGAANAVPGTATSPASLPAAKDPL